MRSGALHGTSTSAWAGTGGCRHPTRPRGFAAEETRQHERCAKVRKKGLVLPRAEQNTVPGGLASHCHGRGGHRSW